LETVKSHSSQQTAAQGSEGKQVRASEPGEHTTSGVAREKRVDSVKSRSSHKTATHASAGKPARSCEVQVAQECDISDVVRAKPTYVDHGTIVEPKKRVKMPPSSYVRPAKVSRTEESFAEQLQQMEARQNKQDPTWSNCILKFNLTIKIT
jgi:hypothetical protein